MATLKCPPSTPEVPPLPSVESGDGSDCSYVVALPRRDLANQVRSQRSAMEACVFVRSVCVSLLWVYRRRAWSGSRPHQRRIPPDRGAFLQQTEEESSDSEDHVTWPDLTQTCSEPSLDSPVVEKIPPTMPHSRTRNCHSGMCCSLTVTISELVSYLTKIPETPWLPAAWFITRSWRDRERERGLGAGEWSEASYSGRKNKWVHLTRSVTENWCVSADIL